MRLLIRLSMVLAALALALSAGAQTRVTCASEQNRPNFCAADTRGGVRLTRQLSDAPCRESDTWGYDRRGIWVDRGCRAEFEVRGGRGPGRSEILTCSSEDFRRQVCPADTRGGVKLLRQISDAECRQGSTWGQDSRGIWVDRGCRGEFEVSSGWGWGRDSGGSTQQVTCESRDRRRQLCSVAIPSNATVRLTRQLSDAECSERRTWGYDQRGIWVDRGCRAEFEVVTRDTRGGRGRGRGDRDDRNTRVSSAERACANEVMRRIPGTSARDLDLEDVTQGGVGTSLIEWRIYNGASGYCRVNRDNRVVQFRQD